MKKISYLSFIAFIMFIASCQAPETSYTKEVAQLDALIKRVDSAALAYEALNHQEVLDALNTIKNDMAAMRISVKEAIDSTDAALFASYNSAKRLIKDFPQRHDRITQEIERTKGQLSSFRDALSSNATNDRDGNPIDTAYVNANMASETRVANSLVEEIGYTIDFAERALKSYYELEPQIKAKLNEYNSK